MMQWQGNVGGVQGRGDMGDAGGKGSFRIETPRTAARRVGYNLGVC